MERYVPVSNADWYLRVWPIRMWYNYPQNIAIIIASLLISLIVLFVTQNNYQLKQMKFVWESEAKSDPLTGIYNRRHFMEISGMNIERARRLNADCYIILFDLDKFKDINDTHGHVVGDKVLIETTVRIKDFIRPYDLFARYGGEEFIIYASDIDKDSIARMVERLRLSLCDAKFEFEGVSLFLSASFGVALVDDYDINSAMTHADYALYTAKKRGRNRTVFWDEITP
jgi:diguanylate cyclase (GGDEF)-like protein